MMHAAASAASAPEGSGYSPIGSTVTQIVNRHDEPKLEIGSGYQPTDGFIHLDLNPNVPDLDWCGPADRLPFPAGVFVEIRAVDVLEHFSYHDTRRVLDEWFRVLRPGGRMYVQVPDAEQMMHRYLQRPSEMIVDEFAALPPIVSIAWRILGGHHDGVYSKGGDDWRLNAHYALFSESSLRWYLEACGFRVDSLTRNPFPNLLAWATRP